RSPRRPPRAAWPPPSRPRTPQLLPAPAPRDRDLEALPLELERVVAGEAAEREHSLCIAAQILALHPPVLAQQPPQRVVAGPGGAAPAEPPRGRPEPGPGAAQPPGRQRFGPRLRAHGRAVAREPVRLPLVSLRGRGPRVDDVVVEVLDVRGHELSRDEGRLGELEGQAEAGEALDDLRDLLLAAVPLMHVGLEAEGVDLHARLEAF